MIGAIDLGIGQPSLALLPLEAMRAATVHCLTSAAPDLLQYGADQGDPGFRRSLAQFLSRRSNISVDADALMVSASVSQALDLVCTRFTRHGDTIFVEEPTYFLALHVFRDHGLRVVGIPMDDDGIRVDALADALALHRPAFLYTVPSFQNPSGTTISAARRAQLMAVCRQHDLLVVADEVYHLLDFGTAAPLPLAAYAQDAHAHSAHAHSARLLSLGSFSKICAPGLRLGWVHGTGALLDVLIGSGLIQSGGGLNPLPAACMRSMLDLGLAEACLDRLRGVYAERSAALCDALRRQLPMATFIEPQGGYFVWLELPREMETSRLLANAAEAGVTFQPGARFSVGEGFANWMRLSFAHYDVPALVEGVHRLSRVLEQRRRARSTHA